MQVPVLSRIERDIQLARNVLQRALQDNCRCTGAHGSGSGGVTVNLSNPVALARPNTYAVVVRVTRDVSSLHPPSRAEVAPAISLPPSTAALSRSTPPSSITRASAHIVRGVSSRTEPKQAPRETGRPPSIFSTEQQPSRPAPLRGADLHRSHGGTDGGRDDTVAVTTSVAVASFEVTVKPGYPRVLCQWQVREDGGEASISEAVHWAVSLTNRSMGYVEEYSSPTRRVTEEFLSFTSGIGLVDPTPPDESNNNSISTADMARFSATQLAQLPLQRHIGQQLIAWLIRSRTNPKNQQLLGDVTAFSADAQPSGVADCTTDDDLRAALTNRLSSTGSDRGVEVAAAVAEASCAQSASQIISPFLQDILFLVRGWLALELDWASLQHPSDRTNSHGGLTSFGKVSPEFFRDSRSPPASSSILVLPATTSTNTNRAASGSPQSANSSAAAVLSSITAPQTPMPLRARCGGLFLPQGGVVLWGPTTSIHARAASLPTGELLYNNTSSAHKRSDNCDCPAPTTDPTVTTTHVLLTTVMNSVYGEVRPLPSLLTPASVLHTTAMPLWTPLSLYHTSGLAHHALHENVKLCRAQKRPQLAHLLETLCRLSKSLPERGESVDGYRGEVMLPVLLMTVRVLQEERLPFWAGIATCCVLLPEVLHASSAGMSPILPLTTHSTTWVALLTVVELVERIFCLVGQTAMSCEARLVRRALERQSKSGAGRICTSEATPHEPVADCAVCGLSVRHINSVSGGVGSTDGCLVIQCVRCGHGGHVGHLADWWAHTSVACCPMGCDCLCIY